MVIRNLRSSSYVPWALVGAWPTLLWQWTQETGLVGIIRFACTVMSWTKSPWQRRQFSCRISAFRRPIMNRLVEILQREGLRVVPAVAGLGDELGDEVVGQMAVDAGGDVVMARIWPRNRTRRA